MKAKKLIEVALPIKEISAESKRDKGIHQGHISTLHLWWARRPLPTCRAAVFASIVPDPLDEHCPAAFGEAIDDLLNRGKVKSIYRPYADIPYTAIFDPVEDNRRNRLLAFIGQFSDKCQKNMLRGESTAPKEQLSDYSLIKWESKDNPEVINLARKLIWIAYNAEQEPSKSYETLSAEFDVAYKAITDAEKALYGTVDRHIECDANWDLEIALKNAIEKFLNRMPSVFDPFAGGGAIPLEAARLGCRSYGNDINPVAHIVEKSGAEFPQKFGKPICYSRDEFLRTYGEDGVKLYERKYGLNSSTIFSLKNRLSFDIEFYAKKIFNKTKECVGNLYPCDKDGKTAIAYYWVRSATCSNPSCRANVPLIKNFCLTNKKGRECFLNPIIHGNQISFEIKRGKCNVKEWNHRGTLTCPCCGCVTDVNTVKKESVENGLKPRLLAIISEDNKSRSYTIPTEETNRFMSQVYSEMEDFRPKEELPLKYTQAFPCCTWGLKTWGDLFTTRQLKFIESLISCYHSVVDVLPESDYSKALTTYLFIWLDKIIICNTSFGKWDMAMEAVHRIYSFQAISMMFEFPESNPFCNSSGSALNQLDWITDYIESESGNVFYANFTNASSGDKLQYEQKSITSVVTDPPYYDAIAYADCSDFFYVWMKKIIGNLYPLNFSTPLTPKSEECTALKHHHNENESDARRHFECKLTQIFDAIEMQTSDIVSIMFAHQSTAAWTTLCNSILNARMNITGSWPLDTELTECGLKSSKAFLESSVTVACRPSERKGYGDFAEVKAAIEKKVADEVESLYQLGFRGADLLTACFGQAVSEFGHYKTVEKADGTEVTVGELLELARNAAFNTLLKGVQGDVYTRFYIGWLQMNGAGDADYDDATKFTRVGLPVDIQDVKSKNLLVGDGKNFHLAMAEEHLGDKGAVIGTRPEDSLIEQVHRAILLYKSEDRALLLALIKNVAQDENGPFWRLLASLKELLPANDDLKQVEGLLQNAADLRESSKEKPREVIGDLFDTAR